MPATSSPTTSGCSSSWSRRGGSTGASRPTATRSDRCGRRWHGYRPSSRACAPASRRSEEHTSELQSPVHLVLHSFPTRRSSDLWRSLFSLKRGDGDAGYFLSDDERLLFVLVEARREHGSFTAYRDAIGPLRAAMARVQTEFPGVRAGLTEIGRAHV